MLQTVPSPSKEWADASEEVVMGYLHQLMEMKLDLSSEEGDYDIRYIGAKLAMCSSLLEKMGDIQLKLTKISLEVTKVWAGLDVSLRLMEERLKASDTYQEQPRETKALWLSSSMDSSRDVLVRFTYLRKVVSEVRGALAEKIQMVKRLDSDIRLQQKLLEVQTVRSSAGNVAGQLVFKPKQVIGELDLD